MPSPVMLSVRGIPRPQPRPRIFRGRAVSTADPNARAWSDAIIRAAHGWSVTGCVRVTLWFKMPTKDAKRWGSAHLHVPDADNLAKLALDALQKAGCLGNDSAVFDLRAVKVWCQPDKAGMVALLESLDAWREDTPDQDTPSWLSRTAQEAGEGRDLGLDTP